MTLSPTAARLALLLWALTWLPGLWLYSVRASRLLQHRLGPREAGCLVVQGLLIAAVPLAGFGAYAVSQALLQAQAGRPAPVVGTAVSVLQVLLPYAVCGLVAAWGRWRSGTPPAPPRWWLGGLVGTMALPLLTPGLFMTQLMVFFG